MELFYNVVRIQRIDQFVSRESTGTPKQFAKKLKISERMLYRYLEYMRSWGAPVHYSRKKCSYYYKKQGRFQIGFLPDI